MQPIKELKNEYLELWDCIYGNNPSYRTSDLMRLDIVIVELEKRGYTVSQSAPTGRIFPLILGPSTSPPVT